VVVLKYGSMWVGGGGGGGLVIKVFQVHMGLAYGRLSGRVEIVSIGSLALR
jgi:hypothetical protein